MHHEEVPPVPTSSFPIEQLLTFCTWSLLGLHRQPLPGVPPVNCSLASLTSSPQISMSWETGDAWLLHRVSPVTLNRGKPSTLRFKDIRGRKGKWTTCAPTLCSSLPLFSAPHCWQQLSCGTAVQGLFLFISPCGALQSSRTC